MSDEKKSTVKEAGARGGRARAKNLSQEERQEIARKAAEARWGKGLPRATYGSEDRPLRIGNIEITCYVLEDETRVITHRAMQRSLGMAQSGGAQRMVNLVARIESKGIDCGDLRSRIESPIGFQIQGGSRAFGYEATILEDLCNAILEAKENGHLQTQQAKFAEFAKILVRGFSRVGIIALVDEATGYQYSRLKDDLQRILEKYVSKEMARWSRVFDSDYYMHIHRLKGWAYNPDSTKRSHALANITVDLTYDRIHPELLKELKHTRSERGSANQKLHQWLTTEPNGGHPRLKQHAEGVTALLSVAKSWAQFESWMDKRYPKFNETPRALFTNEFTDDMDGTDDATSSAAPPSA